MEKHKEKISLTQSGLILLLVVLFLAFVAVMVSESAEKCIGQLLGLGLSKESEKNKILTFLGIGMGGILLALQAVIANVRAQAMVDAANAQAEANENTEQGQRQERLKNAIEHLGHSSDSVRLGGAYELFHLAQDTEDLRQTVMDILCAHIRRTTGEAEYQENFKSKPSEEVQSLLTLLFVQEYETFKNCRINLQGSWLKGADLQKAQLEKAVMRYAHLHEAMLMKAHLPEADLEGAHLHKANLKEACLPGVILVNANLSEADLENAFLPRATLVNAFMPRAILFEAHLPEADLRAANLSRAELGEARLPGADLDHAQLLGVGLRRAYLPGANLTEANLPGADLERAYLYGANLHKTRLQGTYLRAAKLQGVRSDDAYFPQTFANRMRNAINKESDLSGVIFTGGLTRLNVEHIVQDLSDERATQLRAKLEHDIDKPESNELPENSGALTGAYTEEEAERWIAKYEEAMSEVPKTANEQ